MTAGRRALGARGEAIAERWYREHGYDIVGRNWRCREGELDIIAHRAGEVVFSEVKTRSSNAFGTPAEAVTYAKQQRIRRLAMRWLDEQSAVRVRSVRFDVVAITGNELEVIEEAF